MDEVTPDGCEALFMVMQHVVRALVKSGALDPAVLAIGNKALTMEADETLIPQRRADCRRAADLLLALALVAEGSGGPKHPGLRLVQSDAESPPDGA